MKRASRSLRTKEKSFSFRSSSYRPSQENPSNSSSSSNYKRSQIIEKSSASEAKPTKKSFPRVPIFRDNKTARKSQPGKSALR